MRPKISSKRALLIVALSGLVFFAVLLLNFIPKNLTQSSSASLVENTVALSNQEQATLGSPTIPNPEPETLGSPARLKIPSINVDAHIEYVGLTPDGAMDVPKDPDNVAWFDLGPHPGENGSAVMAGHYGWKNNIPAVFDNLHKLRKGDKLYIEDDKGVIITFVVRESRRYNPNDDASDVFGSTDGKSHLNLITCEGVWDKISKTYSKRLVVFTDKE